MSRSVIILYPVCAAVFPASVPACVRELASCILYKSLLKMLFGVSVGL